MKDLKKQVKFAVIIFDNEINNILSEIDADIYLSSLKIKIVNILF